MSLPRPVYAGETVMAQKRCYRGEFRLRPDPIVRQILEYCLARAVEEAGIELHEFLVMFNHDHLEFSDPHGVRPKFLRHFHSLVARAVNRLHGDRDSLYSSDRYTAQHHPTPEDVFDRLVYILDNPVKALICRDPRDFGGVSSWNLEYDKPKLVKRPEVFFGDNMPDEVQLVIRRPKDLHPELSDRALRQRIRGAALARARQHVADAKAKGLRFIGFDRAMRTPRKRATQGALGPAGFGAPAKPHVATRYPELEAEYVGKLRVFRAEYRERLIAWRDGDRTVIFPHGTYKMRVLHGVAVAPP